MQLYKVPIDITGTFSTSDLLFYDENPAFIYARLYENKYDIDYSRFSFLRLVLFDSNNNVNTINSSEIIEENGIKYIKLEIPDDLLGVHMDYNTRITVGIDNKNKQLKRFKIFSRVEKTSDLNTAIILTKRINWILEEYLSSVKRQEIDVPNGLIPLDEDARVEIKYMHDDIVQHIKLEYSGHDTRMNKNRMLEYFDTQDEEWYELNSLNGGDFNIDRKPSEFSYHGGTF